MLLVKQILLYADSKQENILVITLTNELGYPFYVNPDNIEYFEVCELRIPQGETLAPLGVEIHFVSGKSVKVEECMREINNRIKAFRHVE